MTVTVHIIIGFLGSGKTSALLHILHNSAHFEKIGVIVGEFADEGYDGHKLKQAGFPVEMLSGVGRQDQIKAYLNTLHNMVNSEKYQRIFLETSGATEANKLVAALTQDDAFAEKITFGRTINVISGADYDHYTEHFTDQVYSQLNYADLVVLNKIDKVSPEDRLRIKDEIAALNPQCQIELVYMGQVARRSVVSEFPEGSISRLLSYSSDSGLPKEFESFVYRTDKKCVNRVIFGHTLLNLTGRIARFKGVLSCYDRSYGINGVPGQLDWSTGEVTGDTRIAIIGLDLNDIKDQICEALDASLS